MTEFEPGPSGIEGDCCANCATTTTQKVIFLTLEIKIKIAIPITQFIVSKVYHPPGLIT